MKNKILVTVVVPVYNVPEKFLRKCVDSLINQTLENIEIILIDDGTPNTSGKICDELSKIDNRIVVIHQQNLGLCGARNTGVKAAHGKWISFVDGDDWIEKNTYKTLYSAGENNNVDVVMFGYTKDYPSRSVKMSYDKYFQENRIYKSNDELKYLQRLILNYNANCAMAPTKFIRKSVIEKYSIYHDEELRQGAEGIEFNIRLFSKIKSAVFVNENFYHYIYNDESITTVHNEKNHQMVLNCFRKIKEEIDSCDEELIDWFYNRMKYVILTTAISGYFSPSNPEPYSIKKKKFKAYCKDSLVKETLKNNNMENIGFVRRITVFFIKYRMYIFINIISKLRVRQKSKRNR